jgi:hypothetical protein
MTVVSDERTLPAKLKVHVNVDGVAPGDYRGTVRVTVAEAYRPVLEIPVVLTVAEPPAPPVIEE